jgi:hypothetical protein
MNSATGRTEKGHSHKHLGKKRDTHTSGSHKETLLQELGQKWASGIGKVHGGKENL